MIMTHSILSPVQTAVGVLPGFSPDVLAKPEGGNQIDGLDGTTLAAAFHGIL